MSQDSLIFFPLGRWNEIQKIFNDAGSRGFSGCVMLETQRKLEEQGFGYGFKVYCPFGDARNGIVAINIKHKFDEIIIQCPVEDTEKLGDALKQTKIINWRKRITIPFAPNHVIDCVRNVLGDVRVSLPRETFILDERSIFVNVSLPPGTTFGLLSSEHVDFVNSIWPARYENSNKYLQMLVNAKSGYGIFQNDKLITWVFYNESGNLRHLYTIKEQRRKGFAELIVKLVSNVLIGRPILAYCIKDNINAYKLFTKLGFVKSEPVAWCYLNME